LLPQFSFKVHYNYPTPEAAKRKPSQSFLTILTIKLVKPNFEQRSFASLKYFQHEIPTESDPKPFYFNFHAPTDERAKVSGVV